MKKSQFTDQQIAFAVQQAEAGVAVEEVCRKLGISQQTFYRWKKKFAGLGVAEVRRLKLLEEGRVFGQRDVQSPLRGKAGRGQRRSSRNMSVELDHLFICTAAGAPEAARLVEFGLLEGSPNIHPGQGTANRRFFFENALLELLWVADPAEAQAEGPARRMRLWERWSRRAAGACPFGVCFRPSAVATGEAFFPAWEYRPAYLPAPLAIHVGMNSEIVGEPLVFYLPFGRRPDPHDPDPARRQPRDHPAGMRAITSVTLRGRYLAGPSDLLRAVAADCPWLGIEASGENLMELSFDLGRAGKVADFRPDLPLVIRC
jgi:hypothetical protein